jgi:peptidoglycan/LPS O-acetylase OafA/YrhL
MAGPRLYSVYLWQQLIFGFAPTAFRPRIIALPFLLVALLLVAEISQRFIELPMIAQGKTLSRQFK